MFQTILKQIPNFPDTYKLYGWLVVKGNERSRVKKMCEYLVDIPMKPPKKNDKLWKHMTYDGVENDEKGATQPWMLNALTSKYNVETLNGL